MPPKQRIPVGAAPAAFQSPFAGLAIAGLPEGPNDGPADGTSDSPPDPRPGRLVFRKEKAGRCGRPVVIVSGFDPAFPSAGIETIARSVRRHCGCGGTVRNREIEFQGDDPQRFRKVFCDLKISEAR